MFCFTLPSNISLFCSYLQCNHWNWKVADVTTLLQDGLISIDYFVMNGDWATMCRVLFLLPSLSDFLLLVKFPFNLRVLSKCSSHLWVFSVSDFVGEQHHNISMALLLMTESNGFFSDNNGNALLAAHYNISASPSCPLDKFQSQYIFCPSTWWQKWSNRVKKCESCYGRIKWRSQFMHTCSGRDYSQVRVVQDDGNREWGRGLPIFLFSTSSATKSLTTHLYEEWNRNYSADRLSVLIIWTDTLLAKMRVVRG